VPAWDAAAARAAADAYVPPSALEGDPDPAPPWVPYAQRDIDHQRHSHEGLMDHVADVIENKVRRVKPNRLPELVKPDGAGYMPLYCAAQWIATRGGTLAINPLDEAIWREAFKDLRDRIVSGDVKVVGERPDGVSEEISGAHFASCSVDYPFSDRRLLNFNDRVLGNEFCLVSRPYLDDEYWRRGGYDDRLENRQGVRWRRLQVKADVARCWPFGKSQDHRPSAASDKEHKVTAYAAKIFKKNPHVKHNDVLLACRNKFGKLGERAFRYRICPNAREAAGLERYARSGPKPRKQE
jgi:hypothetical protein